MSPTDASRPRGADGRPRNDRPRDALGRLLQPGSTGVEPVPDDLHLSDDETVAMAQRLLDEGRAFAAHEVFEAAWKNADDDRSRAVWRGLAQLMVAVTHAQRGNRVGAVRLVQRGEQTLREAGSAATANAQAPTPVDIDQWVEVAKQLTA
ncbi:MAG: DUF309 domain-containing protein [Actinomycetes bacterium]